MKILYIISSLIGGGAEKLMNDLIPQIKSLGHECELLVLTLENEKYLNSLTKNGVKVTEVPKNKKGHFSKLNYITNYIKNGEFDIVHGHLFPILYYCSFIKKFRLKSIPFVFTEHNTDNRRRHIKFLRPVERLIYKPFNVVISISEETQNCLLKWLRIDKKNYDVNKFQVVYNGVCIKAFNNATPYPRERIINSEPGDEYLICMIGSFTKQKNHLFMIDVMKTLPDEFKLVLLGEGPLKNEIEKKVIEFGLEKRVIMMGFQKEVASIIKACDLVAIPSKWEGFGLIAVEAMACGKPVVCSDVSGLSEVVGDVGIKIELGNTDKFKEGILQIAYKHKITSKSSLYEQANKFGIEQMSKNYCDIYNSL